MEGSILEDVRVACNLNREDDSFDGQLIIHTNSFLFRSAQFGVGKKGFRITGVDEQWSDFVSPDYEYYDALKSYIGLRVLLVFDPPESSAAITLINDMVKEFEWTLYAEADVKED